MEVALRGSSPGATTAGIMLLTRARQLGDHLQVAIVGDPDDIIPIPGPAVLYAPVLASCGVGRQDGYGATVVVPGPPGQPILCTVQPHGIGGWFLVDRRGRGAQPATEAFVRLSLDQRPEARKLGRDVRKAMTVLGMSTDPAVLDVLFGAPAPPLLRLALALRAGRAMAGGRGEPITRFLSRGIDDASDPLSLDHPADIVGVMKEGKLQWVLDRLSHAVHDSAEEWCQQAIELAAADGGRDLELLSALAEIASNLAQLPQHSILPPLGAAEDSVAVGLKAGLTADGDGDANQQLSQMFRFLGGKYVESDPHALFVCDEPPPEDLIGRWKWFCGQVRIGRKSADKLWPEIIDPPS